MIRGRKTVNVQTTALRFNVSFLLASQLKEERKKEKPKSFQSKGQEDTRYPFSHTTPLSERRHCCVPSENAPSDISEKKKKKKKKKNDSVCLLQDVRIAGAELLFSTPQSLGDNGIQSSWRFCKLLTGKGGFTRTFQDSNVEIDVISELMRCWMKDLLVTSEGLRVSRYLVVVVREVNDLLHEIVQSHEGR